MLITKSKFTIHVCKELITIASNTFVFWRWILRLGFNLSDEWDREGEEKYEGWHVFELCYIIPHFK
jgi:hypothetical protein